MRTMKILNYTTPFIVESFNNPDDDLLIQGIAINATTTSNGHTFLAEELIKSAETLKNKPILKDHINSVDAILGRTTDKCGMNNLQNALLFQAKIKDAKAKKMINDGLIDSVSVGATCASIDETENGDWILRDIKFKELSLVAVGADEGATFAKAIAESLNLQEKKDSIQKTNVENNAEEQKMAEKEEALLKEIEEQKKVIEQLTKEKGDLVQMNTKIEELAKKLEVKEQTKAEVVVQQKSSEPELFIVEQSKNGIAISPNSEYLANYARFKR